MKELRTGDRTRHNQGAVEWKPDIPFQTKPVIVSEKVIDGVLHYKTDTGKLYVAEIFDKMFKTPGGKIRPANNKNGLIVKTGR